MCSSDLCMTKSKKNEFRPNDYVVYPAHGVGQIMSIEEQEVAGMTLELFVISFEKDKMTLRVPTHKATEIGMRSLSSPDVVITTSGEESERMPISVALWVGTRRVILSFSKEITNSSSVMPATSCSSIDMI